MSLAATGFLGVIPYATEEGEIQMNGLLSVIDRQESSCANR
jgi:hypothetical protein